MRRAWLLGTALAAVALATPAAADPMVTTVSPEAGTLAPAAGTGFQIYLFGDEPTAKTATPQAGETQPSRRLDRKSVVAGRRVDVRVDLGGRRMPKKKNNTRN